VIEVTKVRSTGERCAANNNELQHPGCRPNQRVHMLIGTTIVLTIVSAMVVGILCGWAAISGILFFFSRDRRQIKTAPAIATATAASTRS
jgi:hypothetical protein